MHAVETAEADDAAEVALTAEVEDILAVEVGTIVQLDAFENLIEMYSEM